MFNVLSDLLLVSLLFVFKQVVFLQLLFNTLFVSASICVGSFQRSKSAITIIPSVDLSSLNLSSKTVHLTFRITVFKVSFWFIPVRLTMKIIILEDSLSSVPISYLSCKMLLKYIGISIIFLYAFLTNANGWLRGGVKN